MAYVPSAVLAGILLTVGIGIIDYKMMRNLRTLPRTDIIIMFVVLLLTVFVDLLTAVGVGMVLAALLFMKKASDIVEHGTEGASDSWEVMPVEKAWEDDAELVAKYGDKVYIKRLEGPLFFGFASRFQEMIQALPGVSIVVIRMGRVPYVDQSGLYAMEEAVMELQRKGIVVVFSGLSGQPYDMFHRINLVPGLVEEGYVFQNFKDCATWLVQVMKDEKQLNKLVLRQQDDPATIGDDIDEI
ncbi:MAG: STAS domain-containing protein [Saprospiraceae bacterium]